MSCLHLIFHQNPVVYLGWVQGAADRRELRGRGHRGLGVRGPGEEFREGRKRFHTISVVDPHHLDADPDPALVKRFL